MDIRTKKTKKIKPENDVKQLIWGAKRTHYIKFQLKHDISIRYHFIWINNPDMEKKWIIKDHQDNIKEVISEELAKRLIADLCIKEPVEIIGKLDYKTNVYTKRIIKADGSCETIDDNILSQIHHKRISKKLWTKSDDKTKLSRKIGAWNYEITSNEDDFSIIINNQEKTGSYAEIKIFAQSRCNQNKDGAKLFFPSEKKLKKLNKKEKEIK